MIETLYIGLFFIYFFTYVFLIFLLDFYFYFIIVFFDDVIVVEFFVKLVQFFSFSWKGLKKQLTQKKEKLLLIPLKKNR